MVILLSNEVLFAAPHLEACLDVDPQSSAMTNALPVNRLGLPVVSQASAPASFVRTHDLSVDRLDQDCRRVPDEDGLQNYDYITPSFEVEYRLICDTSGFVLTYRGLAVHIPSAS